jgi:short-subunit dehydrogenase
LPPDPLPFRATYAATKAYVVAFLQALAGELVGTGIQITVVLPGRVTTEFHTIQGMDIPKLPPTMTPTDLVEGALAGLKKGEVVCVPALEDASLLDQLWETQGSIVRSLGTKRGLAGRYAG